MEVIAQLVERSAHNSNCLYWEEFSKEKIKELLTLLKFIVVRVHPFLMKKTLLLLKREWLVFQPRNERRELFQLRASRFALRASRFALRASQQKWNRRSLGIHICFINVPRYLSSVAYGSEVTNKKISPSARALLKNLSTDFIEWFRGFTVYTREGLFLVSKNW
jgi:hypothetical protein